MDIQMKAEVLSLKNLYKFLTSNDYPVYSEGIIKKDNRIGLTLTKFCYENILVDFRNRKIGKVIWRTEGGRNRYVSEICNRSERVKFYREYAEEIAAVADRETILRQIRQFMSFLMGRQYNYEVFYKKIPMFIQVLAKEDVNFSKEAVSFFENAIEEKAKIEGQGLLVNTFCCGWFLTFLMFHALVGNGEGEEVLRILRTDRMFSLEEMIKLFLADEEKKTTKAVFITNTNTELNSPPLKQGHFFGREEEMFELREMLFHGGMYLISGIGGSGKTELMRQFLRCCEAEGLADYICTVQYEGGLALSLIHAFPQIHGTDISENFKEALARIKAYKGKRILIAIDNMDGGVEEGELEALRKLPATIFVTSRYQKMKGFKTYRLKAISKDAGSLIFRDNYGSRLSEEDRLSLAQIVSKELWCHTLTLRLLGRTAKNNGWSLEKLKKQLEKSNTLNGYTEQERYEGLKQLYRDMYRAAALSKDANRLLRVIAILPYRNYELHFMEQYLQGILKDETDIWACLEQLWISGWLEKSANGYAMHPFISECLLSVPVTEDDCKPFFDNIWLMWKKLGKTKNSEYFCDLCYSWDKEYKELDKDLLQSTMLIRAAGSKVTGKLSEQFIQLFLLAGMIELIYYGASKAALDTLLKIRSKAGKMSAFTTAYLLILLCNYGWENRECLEEEYNTLCKSHSVSDKVKYTYADNLAVRLYNLGLHDKAESYVNELLEGCEDNNIRMSAYVLKADIMMQKGDFAGYGEFLQKGIDLGRSCGREKSQEMQQLLCGMCALNLAYGKFKETERILDELQELTDVENYYLTQQILFYQGSLAMQRGDAGYGTEYLKEACEWAERLFGDMEEANYAVTIVELAMAQNKAGQYEEATMSYKKALAVYESLKGHEFEKHRILNNMSVMYLDQKLYEKALECLPEAYEEAKVMGGLALAETGNNFSKAWRGVGNREKELEYLKEAAPVLEQFYGGEHPKVIDARARLAE